MNDKEEIRTVLNSLYFAFSGAVSLILNARTEYEYEKETQNQLDSLYHKIKKLQDDFAELRTETLKK